MSALHELYISQCLELARLGQGNTHPNPMVGSVVLDAEGRKVGEGFHARYGGPHAEVVALDRAGERAEGGTLYVNLEPCNHTGKTPPCTDRILAAGIRSVICGMPDPNPLVAGEGIRRLEAGGVAVTCGVLQDTCEKLNEAFSHFIRTGQPFVSLKLAMTLDGRIATRNNQSRWITGELARRWVHQLRSQSDGILTTAETILRDNSRLTIRHAPILGEAPVRIILDRQLRLDPDLHEIFKPSPDGGDVWLFTRKDNISKPFAYRARLLGVTLFEVEDTGQGLSLDEVLMILGRQNITQLMVEAGGRLAGSLLRQNRVQKLWLLYGNRILADPSAKPGFAGNPIFALEEAPALTMDSCLTLENTLVLEAYPFSGRRKPIQA